ncbi:MAG: hypothetical protein HKN32_01765, partial [Flavobacteriales bacterium]|nr:hypothetical protein [Flavobacteriales bacterium]
MKLSHLFSGLFLVAVATVCLTGCRDRVFKTYNANIPIYMSLQDWRSMDVELESPHALSFPGKIYIKDDILYVNDLYKGIHVFDYSDPSNLVEMGFLNIPGNIDMAIRNDVLYVDSFYDLIGIDISDINNPEIVSRVEDAFNFNNATAIPGLDTDYPIAEWNLDKGIVTGWTVGEVTTEEYPNYYYPQFESFINVDFSMASSADPSITSVGIGGSMAQFTVVDDHLYTVEQTQLSTYDISDPSTTNLTSEIGINMVGETLFPAQGNL